MSRQAATPAATLSAVMLKNIDNQTIDGEAKSKPEVIKLGLDLHARQVTECRQLDGSTPKPAQQWDPCKLLDKVEEWVKAGDQGLQLLRSRSMWLLVRYDRTTLTVATAPALAARGRPPD